MEYPYEFDKYDSVCAVQFVDHTQVQPAESAQTGNSHLRWVNGVNRQGRQHVRARVDPKRGGVPNALSQVTVANSELPRRRQEVRARLVLWARLALEQVMSRLAGKRCWQGSVAVRLTTSIGKSSCGVLSSSITAAIETAFQIWVERRAIAALRRRSGGARQLH